LAANRDDALAARNREAARVQERENKAKLAALLELTEKLDERDYEARKGVWDDIVVLAPYNPEYARKRQQAGEQLASVAHLREHPEQGLLVEKARARREGFGAVLIVDLTLRNDSLSDLKDFQITCVGKGRSGTAMDSNTKVIYDFVEARKTRTIRNVNMGLVQSQVASLSCTVDSAEIR
jgi:hypothetical protein